MAHKVFVSYHHQRDQHYADELRDFYGSNDTFIDRSLPEEIDSDDDDYILELIRTQHLRDSTVTIVLIGQETWSRKWVDWEIYSSLRPYKGRTVNGLLGIFLPNAGPRMPARFSDNWATMQLPWGIAQTGYARAVHWNDVAPPIGWRSSATVGDILEGWQKRQRLAYWIEEAYQNRTRSELIVNHRPRMKANAPVIPRWW